MALRHARLSPGPQHRPQHTSRRVRGRPEIEEEEEEICTRSVPCICTVSVFGSVSFGCVDVLVQVYTSFFLSFGCKYDQTYGIAPVRYYTGTR